MKRSITAALLAVSLAISLASCGPSEPPVSSSAPPDVSSHQPALPPSLTLPASPNSSFHPALSTASVNLTLSALLYEGLFTLDETFTPQPLLCESWSATPDKLTWTFTLRPGITFSDGTPLTGEAAAQALELARGTGSRYQSRLAGIASVTGTDDLVVISLSAPNGDLPALLDVPISLGGGARPLGTGPYVFTEAGDVLTLTARHDWWQGKERPIQAVSLRTAVQSGDLVAAFDSGDVSLLDTDLTGANALGYSGNYEVWDYSTTRLIYLGFNTASGPCIQAEVRKTLSKAVDRDTIAGQIYAGHARAATLPVHPDSPWYDDPLAAKLAYDPDDLMADLGEAGLLGAELVLLVNSENTARVSAAQQIAYQLESAGLDVALRCLPFSEYTTALASGNFDLYLGETLLSADFDLTALLGGAGVLNYGRFQDPQADTLLSLFRAASGEDRTARAQELLSYLTKQVPFAAVCFKNGSVLTQWGHFSGLSPVQNNIFAQLDGWTIQ